MSEEVGWIVHVIAVRWIFPPRRRTREVNSTELLNCYHIAHVNL